MCLNSAGVPGDHSGKPRNYNTYLRVYYRLFREFEPPPSFFFLRKNCDAEGACQIACTCTQFDASRPGKK